MPDDLFTIGIRAVDRVWRQTVADRFRFWRVRVNGVEVTQSIQHYSAAEHLTDAADRGADNSLRLVARKPAWVRVYVRSGLLGSVTGVTGTLKVERRQHGFLWSEIATLFPQPPGMVTAQESVDYATERGSTANTLNFVVPADTFSGNLRLTVRLTSSIGSEYDTHVAHVDAALLQTLRVRAILVSYNGPSTSVTMPGSPPPPNLNLAAPTLADVQATAGLALRMMPVQSTGNYASAGTLPWTLPLDDPRLGAGGCSANWLTLMTALVNQRTNDGNRSDVVYYGLLPAGIPLNVPGCGQGGLGSAAAGNQGVFVHEIGHGYGFVHTPCGNAGTTDPNYPTYEPYASASIGEYGLDIANGNVLPPNSTFDYMSYCGPQWMSMYQHARLINHTRLDPRSLNDKPWWKYYFLIPEHIFPDWWLPDPPPENPWRWFDMRRNPVISLTGLVHGPGRVEVKSVARVLAEGIPAGEPTALTAGLQNAEGADLATGRVYRIPAHAGCGCGEDEDRGSYVFQAFVPDVARGAALVIRDEREEETIWERRAPEQEPRVIGFRGEIADGALLRLSWEAEQAGESSEAWLQWSQDEGRSWHGLLTGLTEGSAETPLGGLPSGPIQLRLLLHDGFSTAVSEPVRVVVPERPPEVAILHPAEGQILQAGGTLQLWGSVTDAAGQPWQGDAGRWELDGKDAGRGSQVWTTAPAPGRHQARFVVATNRGDVERRVAFLTVGSEVPGPDATSS